jgi:hypothetical protein
MKVWCWTCCLKPSTAPTLALAGLLGTLSGVATLRKLSKNFGNFVVVINRCIVTSSVFMTRNNNSKIALLDREAHEAPLVKEELPAEDDASHCFVYDLAKNRGGRYLDGSYIELPFS